MQAPERACSTTAESDSASLNQEEATKPCQGVPGQCYSTTTHMTGTIPDPMRVKLVQSASLRLFCCYSSHRPVDRQNFVAYDMQSHTMMPSAIASMSGKTHLCLVLHGRDESFHGLLLYPVMEGFARSTHVHLVLVSMHHVPVHKPSPWYRCEVHVA
jgi:hypothetical protein